MGEYTSTFLSINIKSICRICMLHVGSKFIPIFSNNICSNIDAPVHIKLTVCGDIQV